MKSADPPVESSRRHPASLLYVCAVELCERFAASLLASLLVLYLNERLGLAQGQATRLGGVFSGLAYVSSLAGGILADRVLGMRRAIVLGLLLLALGYLAMSLNRAAALYPGLALLIVGQALFKPNLTAIVGKLYAPDDKRREDAYGVFYTAINVGAATAPLAGGALRSGYGWGVAFGAASVAMLLALVVFVIGHRRIAEGVKGADRRDDVHLEARAVVATLVRTLPMMAGLLVTTLLFTAAFEQSGQSLVFWARDCTQRVVLGYTVPPSYFLAVPGAAVLLMQPALSLIMGSLRTRGREPSSVTKISAGVACGVLAYALMTWAAVKQHGAGQVSALWLLGCFFMLTVGEILLYPIGMALITSLVPKRAAAGSMGLWFVAVALGQWLAGETGALWETWPHARFFAMLAGVSMAALSVLALSSKCIAQALTDKSPAV